MSLSIDSLGGSTIMGCCAVKHQSINNAMKHIFELSKLCYFDTRWVSNKLNTLMNWKLYLLTPLSHVPFPERNDNNFVDTISLSWTELDFQSNILHGANFSAWIELYRVLFHMILPQTYLTTPHFTGTVNIYSVLVTLVAYTELNEQFADHCVFNLRTWLEWCHAFYGFTVWKPIRSAQSNPAV